MKLFAITVSIFISSASFAKTEAGSWQGLHTFNRVLVPGDSDQKANYFLPIKNSKKIKINAPLVTTEPYADPERKFKYLKLYEQKNLSDSVEVD
jgi:hypothetical protein